MGWPQAKRSVPQVNTNKGMGRTHENAKFTNHLTLAPKQVTRPVCKFEAHQREINQNQSAQTLLSAIFCMLSSRLFSILQLFHLVGHSSGQGPERCSPPRAPSSCQRETQRGPRDRARAEISFIGRGAADPWLILTLPPPRVSSL